MTDRLERNTSVVMAITGLSRITGLARDAIFSRILATSDAMGAFSWAFLVPNVFRRLFGEGALSAAFLPVYQRALADDPRTASALAGGILGILAVVLGALVVLGEALLFLISSLDGHQSPAIFLTMVTLPYIPLVCIVAIAGAMLHVHGRFGPTASAPLILNGCLIAAATSGWLMFDHETDEGRLRIVTVAAVSVVLAGILQVAWSWLALRKMSEVKLDLAAARGPLRKVFQTAGPMMLGLGVLQANTLFDGLIASWPLLVDQPSVFGLAYPLDKSAMPVLSFAQRLYQFPLGVFGIAVGTAIYPLLTQSAEDKTQFTAMMQRGARLILFIGIPASIGLILVRTPLTRVILQGGAFTTEDTAAVAFVLLGYATSIWAYMLSQILTRAFYARDEVMTPVRVAVGMVGLNLMLNIILIWTPLREAGLAWSTAICAALQSAILLWLLNRRGIDVFSARVRRTTRQTYVATVVMSAAVILIKWGWPTPVDWFPSMLRMLVLVAAGAAAVWLVARMLGMPEQRWVRGQSEA
ncbi:MAG: murein biosynthesis integral membrane protein MurJ [Phycisphaerales bacterium]|nr:murein biosynthesis integral membrane protein MurJ [Phycisphaerales bacterium]